MSEFLVTVSEAGSVDELDLTRGFPLTSEFFERNPENETKLHITCISLVTLNGNILCIDKRKKDQLKGKHVNESMLISLDLAGSGHGVRNDGQYMYRFDDALKDAAKEISEEVYINGAPLIVDPEKLIFLGCCPYNAPDNKEISIIWHYDISEDVKIQTFDSVYIDNREEHFELPWYLFTADQLHALYTFSLESPDIVKTNDGIGRLLEATHGDLRKYIQKELTIYDRT